MWLSNIGTGTECGFQILVPEQKLVKAVFVAVPVFGRHFLFRYQSLRDTFCSGNNILDPYSVLVTRFSRPYFVPVTSFSEGGAPQEFWKYLFFYKRYLDIQIFTYLPSDQNCSG